MMFRATVIQTLRAITSAELAGIGWGSREHELGEGAVGYATEMWQVMRPLYRFLMGCGLTALRCFSWIRLGTGVDRLSPERMGRLLEAWERLPTSLPVDLMRAIRVLLYMGLMDQPKAWSRLGLEGERSYRQLVEMYHGLPV